MRKQPTTIGNISYEVSWVSSELNEPHQNVRKIQALLTANIRFESRGKMTGHTVEETYALRIRFSDETRLLCKKVYSVTFVNGE